MSITYDQAEDLLEARYGGHLSWDDPEWWREMVEMLMEYRSVKALRSQHPGEWCIPEWWPGAPTAEAQGFRSSGRLPTERTTRA